MQEIDQRDRELLGTLQSEIPLVSTPFALIGQAIDMSEKEVIKRIERLKREGLLRQLAAQFDARALGYRSCLVAAKVDPDRIDEAAAAINAHPGVTQNYRRNNDFNLWFTIAVSPTSHLGLEKTIEILGDEAGCETVRALPTLRQFKGSNDSDESHGDTQFAPLTPVEIESVRLLQRDLPLQPRQPAPEETVMEDAVRVLLGIRHPDDNVDLGEELLDHGPVGQLERVDVGQVQDHHAFQARSVVELSVSPATSPSGQ